jgi:GAF domain-containing protein
VRLCLAPEADGVDVCPEGARRVRRQCGEPDEEDEAVPVALGAAAGVAVGNARLYEEARRPERWLRASGEVTQRLLSGAGTDEVLALVMREALEISGADLVVLALPVAGPRAVGDRACLWGAKSRPPAMSWTFVSDHDRS